MTSKDRRQSIIIGILVLGVYLGIFVAILVFFPLRQSVPGIVSIAGVFGLGFLLERLLSRSERAWWMLVIYTIAGLLAFLADIVMFIQDQAWWPFITSLSW